MADVLDTLLAWIDVPSVTGREGDYGDVIRRHLGQIGFATEVQHVAEGRFNVLARAGSPDVVFCTHLDTVPPWIGPRRAGRVIHGRGACDAKGPALAMIEAARRLLAAGEDRLGFLLTVGEEIDSVGASAADLGLGRADVLAGWSPRYTIVGEPTENRFIRGHKGVYKATLKAAGVAGHSSQDVGPSAVHELVHCSHRLLTTDWGRHELFGRGTLNVGQISGGVAPNVVAAEARAELLIRTVEPPEVVAEKVAAALGQHVSIAGLAKSYAPVEFLTPDGSTEVVAFATDAPHLGRWGEMLLYGPGRILDAHTDHECLEQGSFEQAVDDYARTALELLARLDAEPAARRAR